MALRAGVLLAAVQLVAPDVIAQTNGRDRAVRPPATGVVARPDAYSVRQGATLTVDAAGGVLANDAGPKGTFAILLTDPEHGSLTFRSNGGFIYTNDGAAAAIDSFTYKVTDGNFDSKPATVTIRITSAQGPAAVADGYALAHGGTLSIGAPGILGNDNDADGKTLMALLVSGTAHGALALNANGSFTYAHDGSGSTTDSFTYRASNGALLSSPATVTLTIGANMSPTVVNHSYTVAQETPLNVPAPGVLDGATDPDSAHVTTTLVATTAHGVLTLKADGSFSYQPAAGYSGADSFTFRATDGIAASGTATASITVTAAVGASPDSYTAAQSQTLTVGAPGVLGNDSAGALVTSYGAMTGKEQTALGAPAATARGGTVTLSANGAFTYAPPAQFAGTDTFRYVIGNAGGSAAAVVTLSVTAGPTANGDAYSAARNTPRAVAPPGVLANDTVNGATIAVKLAPLHGTVALNGDGSFLYTPANGYAGPDSFTYALTGSGGSSSAVVSLTVFAAPRAEDDRYASPSSGSLVIAAPGVLSNDILNLATIAGYGAQGAEQATLGAATPSANGGSVKLNGDGSFTYAPAAGFSGADSFKYTLANFAGSWIATVSLTVANVPAANADAYQVARNNVLATAAPGVLANDQINGSAIASYGAAGGEQTIIGAATPAAQGGTIALRADGSFTYTPATNFSGTDSFVYRLANSSGSAGGIVTVAVLAPPAAANDGYRTPKNTPLRIAPGASTVLANDTPNGGAIVSYGLTGNEQTSLGQPTPTSRGGSVALSLDGSLAYAPPAGFVGADTFKYTLSNIAGSEAATVTIDVTEAPVAVDDAYTAAANTPRSVPAASGVLANDIVNGAAIASYGVSGIEQNVMGKAAATSAGGSVSLNADGSFNYAPPSNVTGPDSFRYVLSNGTGASTGVVTIAIGAAPVAVADVFDVKNANTTLQVIPGPGVLKNDVVNGATITGYGVKGTEQTAAGSATATAKGGSVSLNADGSFAYSPASGFSGADSFAYTLANAAGSSVTTVTITVWIAPAAAPDYYSFFSGDPQRIAAPGVLANDSPNGALIVSYGAAVPQTEIGTATPTTAGGTVILQVDGSFAYTPALHFNGTDTFKYTLSNFAGSATATVTITVTLPPTAVTDSYAAGKDTPRTVTAAAGVTSNDTLFGAVIVSYGAVSGTEQVSVGGATLTAQKGTIVLRNDSSLTYTPPADFSGFDSFRYVITNAAGSSSTDVSINVVAPPVAVNDTFTTIIDVPLAGNVLTNDTPNGATVNLNALPSHGTVLLGAGGAFTYTPQPGFAGSDSFSYTLQNFAGSANATVSITVIGPPKAEADFYTTLRPQTLGKNASEGVLANDAHDSATITSYGSPNGTEQASIGLSTLTAQGGSVSLTADGAFTYRPRSDFLGDDTFKYVLTTAAGKSTGTVTISVVEAPVAKNDEYRVEGTLNQAAPGVLGNDKVNLAVIDSYGVIGTEQKSIGQNTPTANGGAVSVNASGSFSYVPPARYFGNDTFKYVLKNEAGSSTATVTFEVAGVYAFQTSSAGLALTRSNDLKDWTDLEYVGFTSTASAPGSVVFNGELYSFYASNDGHLSYEYSNDGKQWFHARVGNLFSAGFLPTVPVVFNGALYVFHASFAAGILGYFPVVTTSNDGKAWTIDNVFYPLMVTGSMSAVAFKGKLYLFGQNVADGKMTYLVFDGNDWIPRTVETIGTANSPAALVFNDTLYLFYLANSELKYTRSLDGSSWAAPISTGQTVSPFVSGGSFPRSVAPVVFGGKVTVFFPRLDESNDLRILSYDLLTGITSPPISETTNTITSPSAAVFP